MNSTLAFLESLGRDETLARSPDLAIAARAAGVAPELADALARRDRSALELLLGARHNLVCAVFPVVPGEGEQEPKPDEEPQPQDPPQQRAA